MRKNCLPAGIESAAFGLHVHFGLQPLDLPLTNIKSITIDLLLKSYNKQVAGLK